MNKKEKKKQDKESLNKEFTAYIIKGNRQVIEREVNASKRFVIGDDTYIIKSECIFLKKVGTVLKSISVYKEGNPNPFSFNLDSKGQLIPNTGLPEAELNEIYGGDMFNILIEGQHEDKMNYTFLMVLGVLVMSILSMFVSIIGV